MGSIGGFLIAAVITAISLLIMSYIPFLGIEIDSPWQGNNFRSAVWCTQWFSCPDSAVCWRSYQLYNAGLVFISWLAFSSLD